MEMNLRAQKNYEMNFVQAVKVVTQWLARPVKELVPSHDGLPMKLVRTMLLVAAINNYGCLLQQHTTVNIAASLSKITAYVQSLFDH